MTFKNDTHKVIFKTYLVASPLRYPKDFLAAVFLLSAEKELWRRTKKAIKKKKICFEEIEKAGLSAYAFALYHIAHDIYNGTHYVILKDLGDEYLISDKTFDMAVSALEIARNGYSAFGMNKQIREVNENGLG